MIFAKRQNPYRIKRINMLGHSQTSTTLNFYAHAVQQANEKALNRVAAVLQTG